MERGDNEYNFLTVKRGKLEYGFSLFKMKDNFGEREGLGP